MSPILVRPVREQLEHDRVIRLLQAKYKRKFDVAINLGNEQAAPVGGPPPWFPDLVLQSGDKNRKLLGVVEVETAESVNHLEAMSQWAAFSRFRVPFHLYVPVGSIDTARRLCADLESPPAEVWAYNAIGDQMRFTLVQKSAQPEARRAPAAPAASAAKVKPAAKPAASSPATPRTRTVSPPATPRARAASPPARPARRAAAPATTSRRKPVAKAKAAAPPRRAAAKSARKPAARPAARPARPQKRR